MRRRDLLGVGVVGSVGMLASVGRGEVKKKGGKPKNVVVMVSDGMSLGVPSMEEAFRWSLEGRGTEWLRMWNSGDVTKGLFDVSSLNSLVPDSAAVASAWGSGTRVFNGVLNVLPDGRKLKPIGALIKEKGMKLGLVTTTRITHATPAGFASSVRDRDNEGEVALQYLDMVDVLMGGGARFFEGKLPGKYVDSGYEVLRKKEDLGKEGKKILGLFGEDHLPFVIDRKEGSIPSLAEMTEKALEVLGQGGESFFLMVEGGRVDHAAHFNDGAAILWEQLDFDKAVEVVRKFAKENQETLLIVTSDHGNSNPGLVGMGTEYELSTECFKKLLNFKKSAWSFLEETKKKKGNISDQVEESFGLKLGKEELGIVEKIVSGGRIEELSGQQRNPYSLLAEVLGNYTGVGWAGKSHTGDLMPVMAYGPGSEMLAGLHGCVYLFELVTDLLGIRYKNPNMNPEKAAKYQAFPKIDRHPHWIALS